MGGCQPRGIEIEQVIWSVSAVLSTWISARKGKPKSGFAIGALLGPLGVLVALVSSGEMTGTATGHAGTRRS